MTTLTETFANIAEAIRIKEGTTDSIPAAEFANRIAALETGGALMCAVTFVNDSDDSIKIYPRYEGSSDYIEIDRFASTSIAVPKNSAVWFNGWVPLGASINPDDAGDSIIGSCTYEGMVSIYADGIVTIKNN